MENTLTRRLVWVVVLVFVALGGLAIYKYKNNQVTPQPPPQIIQQDPILPVPPVETFTVEQAVATITSPELKKHVEFLASKELEGRMSGKKGNVIAFDFIKKQYESYGLPTMYHRFKIDRKNPGPQNETGDDFTQNVYAWIDGSDPTLKDEIVVVGAHGDHIGYGPSYSRASSRRAIHPGADDNASGTAALLEIAQAFSKLKGKVKRTIVFQSYSAEEMGLIGSRYYCNNPVFPVSSPNIRKHVFMLNMDMISYLNKGQYFADWSDGNSSINLSQYISELNGRYTFARKITSQGSGGSDHASFYNKRVPVAFLHTGLHPHYHTPTDTADKLNYEGMEQVARYAFELSHRVVQGQTTPKFNLTNFKEMPYDHDHGHPETHFQE